MKKTNVYSSAFSVVSMLVSLAGLGLSIDVLAAEAKQATTTSTTKQPLDRIVAIVNDSVITNNELNREVDRVVLALNKRNMPVPPEKILRKQVLDHMINNELELQMAKNAGIELDSHDVDIAIENIAKQHNVSVETLRSEVEAQGLTWKAYRHNIKNEMTVSDLQHKAVGSIIVTDQEVDNYMASNANSFSGRMSESFHLEDIVIPLPADPSSKEVQEAQQRAFSVLTRLKNGANFNEIAVEESSGNDALQGGDLGFRQLPELPEAFATAVVKMKPGDLSQPIRTANGWHIIKLVAVQGGGQGAGPTKEQVKRLLFQRNFNEALENWMIKIRGTSYIQTFL